MHQLNCEVLEAREEYIQVANAAAQHLIDASIAVSNGKAINRLGVLQSEGINVDRLAAILDVKYKTEIVTAHALGYNTPSVEREWHKDLRRDQTWA